MKLIGDKRKERFLHQPTNKNNIEQRTLLCLHLNENFQISSKLITALIVRQLAPIEENRISFPLPRW